MNGKKKNRINIQPADRCFASRWISCNKLLVIVRIAVATSVESSIARFHLFWMCVNSSKWAWIMVPANSDSIRHYTVVSIWLSCFTSDEYVKISRCNPAGEPLIHRHRSHTTKSKLRQYDSVQSRIQRHTQQCIFNVQVGMRDDGAAAAAPPSSWLQPHGSIPNRTNSADNSNNSNSNQTAAAMVRTKKNWK